MANKNYIRTLHDAKAMGRFEGMAALVEVAIVAIHNIFTEHEWYEKWERTLINELEGEIKSILQIKECMSAEDIGDLVVGHAERLRKESEEKKK